VNIIIANESGDLLIDYKIQNQPHGTHTINADDILNLILSSGVYYAKLITKTGISTHTFIINN
jgi:hypothetical protein